MAELSKKWSDPKIQASQSVLMEVMTILSSECDNLVIVGGWVPELLFPDKGHMGSLDVDLALDPKKIKPSAYDAICKRLCDAGYRQETPFGGVFYRDIGDGKVSVKVDLLTGIGDTPGGEKGSEIIQDMRIGKLRGINVALQNAITLDLMGHLPDGAINNLQVKIASAAAFLCMKSHALNERKREKDAFDMYFCQQIYGNKIKDLAEQFRPLLGQPEVDQSVEILGSKYATIKHIGPQWAAQYAEQEVHLDFDKVERAAYEIMNSFLELLQD